MVELFKAFENLDTEPVYYHHVIYDVSGEQLAEVYNEEFGVKRGRPVEFKSKCGKLGDGIDFPVINIRWIGNAFEIQALNNFHEKRIMTFKISQESVDRVDASTYQKRGEIYTAIFIRFKDKYEFNAEAFVIQQWSFDVNPSELDSIYKKTSLKYRAFLKEREGRG